MANKFCCTLVLYDVMTYIKRENSQNILLFKHLVTPSYIFAGLLTAMASTKSIPIWHDSVVNEIYLPPPIRLIMEHFYSLVDVSNESCWNNKAYCKLTRICIMIINRNTPLWYYITYRKLYACFMGQIYVHLHPQYNKTPIFQCSWKSAICILFIGTLLPTQRRPFLW